jgi:hypothetical protein
MYKDDALTRYTRAAGQQIMALVMAQPQGARSEVVRSALESIKPGLHAKVDRLAGKIAAGGISTLIAYEEALRLALADVFVESVRALAITQQTGRTSDEALAAQRLFYGELHPAGLGGLDGGLGNAGRDAANFALNLLRSAACSEEVKSAITGAITNEGARTATSAGLDVAKGVAACNRLPGATPPPPPPPPPPERREPAAQDNTNSLLMTGAAVIALGTIIFFALKK